MSEQEILILACEELTQHEVAGLFPAMSETELSKLTEDISQHGQHDPIWITDSNEIIDGRHRAMACERLGRAVLCRVYTGSPSSYAAFVVSLNLHRRHLSESQRAMVASRLATLGKGQPESNTPIDVLKQAEAAEKLNVSHRAVQRARKVLDTGASELIAAVDEGRVAVSTAADVATLPKEEQQKILAACDPKLVQAASKDIRAEKAKKKNTKKAELAKAIEQEPVPLPTGPFRVIAIDPPWQYNSRVEDDSHRGRNQYPDMNLDEICALPLDDLAHDDCVLWLWTTNAFMREAYTCLDAWGFTAKTILTWDKVNMGLGDYLRNVTEHCIVATRGKPVFLLTNQTTLIQEKRREHSRKPEAFYALVEAICPGSKLEMFARQKRVGWQSWGAEEALF